MRLIPKKQQRSPLPLAWPKWRVLPGLVLALAPTVASADLIVTAATVWTASQASIDDDIQMDSRSWHLGSGSIASGSVVQFGNWPEPGSAQAFGAATMDLAIDSDTILVTGSTIAENQQTGGPPNLYSHGMAFLEFEFLVIDPTVLLEYSVEASPWTFFELVNEESETVIETGMDVPLNPGYYRFTLEQFEYHAGSHSDPQNAEMFSLVLVENGSLSVIVPEPSSAALLTTGLLLAGWPTRRRARAGS